MLRAENQNDDTYYSTIKQFTDNLKEKPLGQIKELILVFERNVWDDSRGGGITLKNWNTWTDRARIFCNFPVFYKISL